MNLNEIANQLVSELSTQATNSADNSKHCLGAIEGIKLFYSKIMEQQNTNQQDIGEKKDDIVNVTETPKDIETSKSQTGTK